MTRRDYALGRLDLSTRAERVKIPDLKVRIERPIPDDAEFTRQLERATDVSLMQSPSWRAGLPLADGERWHWTVASKTGKGATDAV